MLVTYTAAGPAQVPEPGVSGSGIEGGRARPQAAVARLPVASSLDLRITRTQQVANAAKISSHHGRTEGKS